MHYEREQPPAAFLKEMLLANAWLAPCEKDIFDCYEILRVCFQGGGKLLAAGNGGSAADSGHIVGELMKGFLSKRPLPPDTAALFQREGAAGACLAAGLQGALPAISLTAHDALLSAYANDVDPTMAFAQQVYGYGRPGDVFWGLSTSGRSQNVVKAAHTARILGLRTICVTGENGGPLAALCDAAVRIPASSTPLVQEGTLPVYHAICRMLELSFFGGAQEKSPAAVGTGGV